MGGLRNQVSERAPLLFRTFGWLFGALCFLALLSAPDATHDEAFHLANIYCGQGERLPYCSQIRYDVAYPSAVVDMDFATCQRIPNVPLACPRVGNGTSVRSINHGDLYPGWFYWVMSWFVVSSQELSVILARFGNALIITLTLAVTALILPRRHLQVMNMMMFTTLPATGYFLFSSVNPSSWTVLGVGFGWLTFHAAISSRESSGRTRVVLFVWSAILWLLATASRWDAIPYAFLTVCLIAIQSNWPRLVNHKFLRHKVLSLAVGVPALISVPIALIEWIAPIHVSPLRYLKDIISYSGEQPNNLQFFSHYVLDVIPMSLSSLSSVPTTTSIGLPRILSILNVAILILVLIGTRKFNSYKQLVGLAINILFMTLVVTAWVDSIDDRDLFGIEPRYVLPLLVFTVGWWLIDATDESLQNMTRNVGHLIPIAILMHALMAFAVVERYVDRQTFGLRILPEGTDNWWWSQLPVGPNAALIMAAATYSVYLRKFHTQVLISKGSGV